MNWNEMSADEQRDMIFQKHKQMRDIDLDVVRVHREINRIKRIFHGKMEDLNAALEGIEREKNEIKAWLAVHLIPERPKAQPVWSPDELDALLYNALQVIDQLKREFLPDDRNSELRNKIQDYLQKKKKHITGRGDNINSVFYPESETKE